MTAQGLLRNDQKWQIPAFSRDIERTNLKKKREEKRGWAEESFAVVAELSTRDLALYVVTVNFAAVYKKGLVVSLR